MSGVYIKGIEMQTDAPLKIILHPNGQLFVDHGTWYLEHEAVFVPDHGRLGDLDEAIKHIPIPTGWATARDIYENIKFFLNNAPTIIPADADKDEQT